MSALERMLKPREVAELLGVHVNTVKRMSDRGEIPCYRIVSRGDRRYLPSDIDAYLSTITGATDGRASGKRA